MAAEVSLIPDVLPILSIRNRVMFPSSVMQLTIGRQRSVSLVENELWVDRKRKKNFGNMTMLGVITVCSKTDTSAKYSTTEVKDSSEDEELYSIGTAVRVTQLGQNEKSSFYTMLIEGICRFRIKSFQQKEPHFLAQVEQLEDTGDPYDPLIQALTLNLRESSQKLLDLSRSSTGQNPILTRTKELIDSVSKALPGGQLADLITISLDATVGEKQDILETVDLKDRISKVLNLVTKQMEIFKLSQRINSQVETKLNKTQREFYLRQQLKAIMDELGENTEGDQTDIENRLLEAGMPEAVYEVVKRELRRFQRMQPNQPEYGVIFNYLEWMAELPWNKSTSDILDIETASMQFERDHYALQSVKKRLLEYLSVLRLKKNMRGPIICLIGPPGVGKTSLGRSIAAAMGRKFCKISLGGVRDEAEIRGHRRTYVGAMPGRIIQCLIQAGSNNPVILLDEIDKLTRDFRGDPASALLEVLDPEQNNSFVDHYINAPFDLSKVLFLATANQMDTIPAPLFDRMEVVQLSGYTFQEKIVIAREHLLPKQLTLHGLQENSNLTCPVNIQVDDDSLLFLISHYTREAGVRNLDREIASLCRHVASCIAKSVSQSHTATETLDHSNQDSACQGSYGEVQTLSNSMLENPRLEESKESNPDMLTGSQNFTFSREFIEQVLGPVKFESQIASTELIAGVATGLAWTAFGGDILFVEAAHMPGDGKLILTGQLGEVMQESAQTALSWVKSSATDLGISSTSSQAILQDSDIHIHFPAGAIPKDGPSAGVTIAIALVSLLTHRKVRSDTAMTGEINLRGMVMPVGGIKEKILAAQRAGLRRVILPIRNEKDVHNIPDVVLENIECLFVETISQAMELVFTPSTNNCTSDVLPCGGAALASSRYSSDMSTFLLSSKL